MSGSIYQWPYKDKTLTETWAIRQFRLGSMTYAEYLLSDEWALIKAKAVERPYYQRCYACSSPKLIALHHATYFYLHTDTPMIGIIALCGRCHIAIHDLAKQKDL